MARHNTHNGPQCCNYQSPFKSTVDKGYKFPCSAMITQIARREMSIPSGWWLGGWV